MTTTSAALARATVNPWVIAVVVAMAAFMEVLDTTIANVVLPYIGGALAVSSDEASWVVTTYLVANAVALTSSSFLARRLGRKRFFLICVVLFTISSVLCGLAWNLQALLVFRIMQGLGGGGMVPVAQSILADAFPPEKRGQAFAMFGLAVVVAPVVGPTLGGYLADNVGWQWCFLVNGPVGILLVALVWMLLPPSAGEEERRKLHKEGLGFDMIGFVLVAVFLGSLEVILDRGLEDDWLGSAFIVTMTIICALAFALMIPWEFTRKNPVIDLRMVATGQFGACFLVMLMAGAILLATTQILPLLVQQNFGYTATWAGLMLSPGGVVTMIMVFLCGRLLGFVQPKYLIAAGGLIVAAAMWGLTSLYGDVTFSYFAWSRIYVGVGLPLILIPVLTAAYAAVPPGQTDQASALINAARNIGGSIGISLSTNVLAHRAQFHQSRLAENVSPSDPEYQDTLRKVTEYFTMQGSPHEHAHRQAIEWIGQQVELQASFLAYIDVFWTLMLLALAIVPLALLLRRSKPG